MSEFQMLFDLGVRMGFSEAEVLEMRPDDLLALLDVDREVGQR